LYNILPWFARTFTIPCDDHLMDQPRKRSWNLLFPTITLAAACALSAGLAGCSGSLPAATPTVTLAPASETPTIAWFPATNTPTLYVITSPPPTPEPLPGVGSLLFEDDFSAAALWDVNTSGTASAQVEANHLTLAVASGPLRIDSLRSEPSLGDFYAQVTANVNLCQGDDQYGLLLRVAPGGNYYRFILACNGNLRLERVRSGAAEVLQNWIPSGDVPPGGPAEVRIGIWASGAELRFLLNDRLQISLRDPVSRSGRLGFFAYASGATPVIVSFSRLEVYAVAYISPTPTRSPTRTPIP
jgi:hypothetical protein